jgi:hypothetical protein
LATVRGSGLGDGLRELGGRPKVMICFLGLLASQVLTRARTEGESWGMRPTGEFCGDVCVLFGAVPGAASTGPSVIGCSGSAACGDGDGVTWATELAVRLLVELERRRRPIGLMFGLSRPLRQRRYVESG